MAAHFTRHFSRSLPERVLIFFAKSIQVLPFLFFLAIHKNAGGIISEGSLGADNRIQATVRPWTDHIVLKQNGAPLQVLMMLVFMSPQTYFSARLASPWGKLALTYSVREASGELTETM